MFPKSLLRRKIFLGVNVMYLILTMTVGIEGLVRGTHTLLFRVSTSMYSCLVATLIYLFGIHKLKTENMMYEMYLPLINAAFLSIILFFRFLVEFQKENPFFVILDNILAIIVAVFSIFVSVYIAIVRKCIVDALICPVFIQRRKKIESIVVFVRREYPEIFSVQ